MSPRVPIPRGASCANCARVKDDAAALQRADAKRILTLQFDLTDADKALAVNRRALVDLWGFFDRVAKCKGDWSTTDVRRIAEIERIAAAARPLIDPCPVPSVKG
jgi:hypothetical protein